MSNEWLLAVARARLPFTFDLGWANLDILQLVLVVSSKETVIAKPNYPTGDNVTEEKKAEWGKEYDLFIKKNTKHEQDKAHMKLSGAGVLKQ